MADPSGTLELESNMLVGRTAAGRGPAQSIACQAPLALEDGRLTLRGGLPSTVAFTDEQLAVIAAFAVRGVNAVNGIWNPKDFGAAWDGVTDDTVAIQSAINAARSRGGMVWLPPGMGCFLAPLDCTNSEGLRIAGSGSSWPHSILKAIGTSSPHSHLLDCTGAKALKLQDFTLTNIPQAMGAGIFVACSTVKETDMMVLENLYVSGYFTYGALCIAKTGSGYVHGCKFYNVANIPSAPPTLWLSVANGMNAGSAFATVAGSAGNGVSDLTFVACEVHDGSQNPNSYGAALFDGAASIRFFGGNFSQYVGSNAYCTCYDCDGIAFYGTGMYVDIRNNPRYVFEIPSGHPCRRVGLDAWANANYTTAIYHGVNN